jgi:hypothetical protein
VIGERFDSVVPCCSEEGLDAAKQSSDPECRRRCLHTAGREDYTGQEAVDQDISKGGTQQARWHDERCGVDPWHGWTMTARNLRSVHINDALLIRKWWLVSLILGWCCTEQQ